MAASGSLGRTHYFKGKFISSDLCFILAPKADKKLDLKFYYRVFNFLREDIVKKTATGTSKLAINQTNFGIYKLPYFDIEHQLAFSGKLDRISKIKNSLVAGFSEQSSFLSLLRQSILQEAIEGKLTEAWRKKNPVRRGDPETDASALLEKIKAEKQKLIAKGEIRKEKPLAPINPEEVPFELPEGWVWCRMGEFCDFITKGTTPQTYELKPSGDIPYLKVYNLVNQKIDFEYRPQFISEKIHQKDLNRSKVYPGDVLMNIVGPPLGKVAIVPDTYKEWNINQALAIFRPLLKSINKFLYLYLLGGFEIKKIHTLGVVGQDNISLDQCRNIIFPLSPLAEQQASVEKVGLLMAMIDKLEKQVSERKDQAEMLMQSVLREAFEGR